MLKRFLLCGLLILISSIAGEAAVKKVGVILIKFQDAETETYTSAAIKARIFTDPDGVNAFYTEQSFGAITLEGALASTGDVFGWYTVPYLSTDCYTEATTIASAARVAAANDGYVFSNYDVTIYAFNKGPETCGAARAGIYLPLEAGAMSTMQIIAHELGHAFGREHANAYRCVDGAGAPVAFSSNCVLYLYANPYTLMGSVGFGGHFSVFEKARDWSPTPPWTVSGNIQTVTANGDYTIYPLEQSTANPMALRIARGGGQYLYIEFRKTYGFDSGSFLVTYPGVILYFAGDPTVDSESQLLDMTPGTDTFLDAALAQGQSFTDSGQGLTVTALTVTPGTSAVVRVAFSGSTCTSKAPYITVSPYTQSGNHGDTLNYSFTLLNPNIGGCANATYSVVAKAPSGWAVSPTSYTETLTSGASVTRAFTVTSKATTRAGDYKVYQKATNSAIKRLSTTAYGIYQVTGP